MESMILKMEAFQFSEPVRERVITGIRLVCLFLFLYTAYAKIVDHERFLTGLTRVHFVHGAAMYISWLVPFAEILASVFILIPQTAKWGLYAFISLMTLFTGYIISALIWEEKLPCHCGGAIEKLSWTQHLWFNLAFILLAIFALRLINSKYIFKKHKK